MTRLLLARHGQTDWNMQRRFQGQADIPLHPVGLAQAAALGRRLASERVDGICASDLERARRTAEAIAGHHGLEVTPDVRLREVLMGAWEGLTFAEVERRDPEALARWVANPATVSLPGGETLTTLAERVRAVLDDLRQRPEEESIALVSHGGTLQVLLCLALGMPPENHWRLRVDEASLSELYLYPEGAILTRLNDRHHLDGLTGAWSGGISDP